MIKISSKNIPGETNENDRKLKYTTCKEQIRQISTIETLKAEGKPKFFDYVKRLL